MNISHYRAINCPCTAKESDFNSALRIARLNSKALSLLIVITLATIVAFIHLVIFLLRSFWLSDQLSRRLTEQSARLNQTNQMLDHTRSLVDQSKRRNFEEGKKYTQTLRECVAAEEKRRCALKKISQDLQGKSRFFQMFQSKSNRETFIHNQLLEATHAELQARTTLLDSVTLKIVQQEAELGELARRYREFYKTWGQQDTLVFEFIPPEFLKMLISADKKTMIEGFLRHHLFETCSISLEPIFDFHQCVFLDTNPRVGFNHQSLERHIEANGLVCPTTRNRIKVAYFPFRSSKFDTLSGRAPSSDFLASISATFKEYRRQRVDDLVRETDKIFNVTCSVSDALVRRPEIAIALKAEHQ